MPDAHPRLKKKKSHLSAVKQKALENLNLEMLEVEIERIDEIGTEADPKISDSEIDELELAQMWSLVGHPKNPRWLWHAIDRLTGKVLAYVFERRKDEVFLKLKKLLAPFGIKKL